MPSTCPKCRAVLEEDEICCAQVRYTWRCKSCFKLTSGLAMQYGKCFLCGGELEAWPQGTPKPTRLLPMGRDLIGRCPKGHLH